jgi:hypothetical protein
MSTPVLAVNHHDGGTPQAKRWANTSVSAQGVTFGAIDVFTASATAGLVSCCDNRLIQYGGNNTWLCVTNQVIWRSTDAGASWTNVQSMTNPSTTQTILTSGIWTFDSGGTQKVCVFYYTATAGRWKGYTSTDGITWSASSDYSALHTAPSSAGIVSQVMLNGTLYMATGQSAGIATVTVMLAWSPGSDSASSTTIATITGTSGNTLAAWKNSIYCVAKTTQTSDYKLFDMTSGSAVLVATLFTGPTTALSAGARPAEPFVDPATGDLICWIWPAATNGWTILRVSSSFVVTDITSSVRPTALSGTSGGGNSPASSRIRTYVDQEAQPGANPDIHLGYSTDGASGTTVSLYLWNGVASAATLVSSGGNVAHSIGYCSSNGGGAYTWTSGEKHARIVSWAPATNGVTITFKLYSDSGSASVKVRAFTRRNTTQDFTKTAAEIKSPSAGALSGTGVGNYNTGLTADNGTTTYTLVVDLAGIGWSLVEQGRILLDVVDP